MSWAVYDGSEAVPDASGALAEIGLLAQRAVIPRRGPQPTKLLLLVAAQARG
jgi:hypothetical protein